LLRIKTTSLFILFSAVLLYGRTMPQGWLRTEPIGPVPERITETLPLSDQGNEGEWIPYQALWDEFEGEKLDAEKWHDRNPGWLGRQPGYFYPGNVQVHDGQLHLLMQKQEVPEMPKDQGYHTYTSAAVKSKITVLYGYFEVKCRPMKSHGSSSFWFYEADPNLWTEIDVFEIGGGAAGFEKKVNMNLHVFQTPTDPEHWETQGIWSAAENLADDFHVYGLEWDAEKIKWYFDGVLIRWVENTHWHQPLTLNFDSETMPDWFGLPQDSDLPSTFSVEYVRVWKRAAVEGIPLFADMSFANGFKLSFPDSARGRQVDAVLNYDRPLPEPVTESITGQWRICQWATKYDLAGAKCIKRPDGDMEYRNEGKRIVHGGPQSKYGDLLLEIFGQAEYGQAPRTGGQSWPHLLIEQDAVEVCPLSRLEKINLRISIQLAYCDRAMKMEEYDPNLHTAQFQLFLIVKNIKPESPDFNNYFWFGVPFFDYRHEIPPLYMAEDGGKADATRKFIYTMPGERLNPNPLKSGQWVTIRQDLLMYIQTGLQEAAQRGFLTDADPADYAVVNMNMGWEIPGTFNTGMAIKYFSLRAVPASL